MITLNGELYLDRCNAVLSELGGKDTDECDLMDLAHTDAVMRKGA